MSNKTKTFILELLAAVFILFIMPVVLMLVF
jgi:hypothetical protein